MLSEDVLRVAKEFQVALKDAGIEADFVVVFGSQVTGKAHEWSDIDLLVVSSQFDGMSDRSRVNQLWRLTAQVDSRIEPFPCGAKQWREEYIVAFDGAKRISPTDMRRGKKLA